MTAPPAARRIPAGAGARGPAQAVSANPFNLPPVIPLGGGVAPASALASAGVGDVAGSEMVLTASGQLVPASAGPSVPWEQPAVGAIPLSAPAPDAELPAPKRKRAGKKAKAPKVRRTP